MWREGETTRHYCGGRSMGEERCGAERERVVGTGAGRYILEGEKEVETRIGNFICSNKYLPWIKQ